MTCRHCSASLPKGAPQCPGCKAAVIEPPKEGRIYGTCPTCDSEIFPASRFCWHCGSPLGAPDAPSLPRALEERRQVTILHADIVGFTEFAESLAPEAVKERLDGILGVLIGEVVLRGGAVDKLIGDAVLALFGGPDALGDDAVRAVEAGLAMHRALKELQGEGGEDDRGGRCDLNQNGEWHEDDDDQHCSRRTLTSTLDCRQLPPGELSAWVDA